MSATLNCIGVKENRVLKKNNKKLTKKRICDKTFNSTKHPHDKDRSNRVNEYAIKKRQWPRDRTYKYRLNQFWWFWYRLCLCILVCEREIIMRIYRERAAFISVHSQAHSFIYVKSYRFTRTFGWALMF